MKAKETVNAVAVETTKFLFDMYDCTFDSDVGTCEFSLVLGILHMFGHEYPRSHLSPGVYKIIFAAVDSSILLFGMVFEQMLIFVYGFLQEYESKDAKANSLENEKREIEKQRISLEEMCSSLKIECASLKEQVCLFSVSFFCYFEQFSTF